MDTVPLLTLVCLLCAVVQPTHGQNETTTQVIKNATDSATNDTTTNDTTTMYPNTGTTQELFNCNSTGCLNGGACLSNGTCSCSDWFKGEMCAVMTECPPGYCSLAGALDCTVNNMSEPVCHCSSEYIGVACEHKNICLKSHPCKNNGMCEMKEDGEYTCSCVTGDPHRDCSLNNFNACSLNPPVGDDKHISCIDLIVDKRMLCTPAYKGVGCQQSRNASDYCLANNCFEDTGSCKPLCNREECNGTTACNFTEFSSDGFTNITDSCRRSFADGYEHPDCNHEENLFDGLDAIRNQLKDCSPFFDTICTQNVSDGICNPHCNNTDCLWDGLDCVNENLETFDGSIMIEFKNPVSARKYSQLGLVLRSGVYYHQFYNNSLHPQLQLKVVKPQAFQNAENTTIGQFTSIRHAGMFLASFAAKLPLNITDITDIYVCEAGHYGDKCSKSCSEYCTKEGDNICDFKTGECMHGCRTQWWGEQCLNSCPRGCSGQCNRDTGKCESCVDGTYGAENCSYDCDSYCRGVKCDLTSGYCDCGEGRYYSLEKPECSECSVGCEGTCGISGNCTCKVGYFGTMCGERCSEKCKADDCDATNGRCMGCKAGYHGDSCEKTCGLGCTECQQDSGSCGGKCREGYEGDTCQRSTQSVTDNTGVVVAVVVAVLIILIIIIVACCYWKYRQAGDYVLKDEEDDDPVPKATSQEVKAHYGMQPLQTPIHTSSIEGHSSEMIDMDAKPTGDVYAGPAVTVAYTKVDESVAFDETNNPAKEVSEESKLDHADTDKVDDYTPETTEDTHIANSANVTIKFNVDANHVEVIEDNGARVTEDADAVKADGEQDATEERKLENTIRAPLASEEDLTAPKVNAETVNPPPDSSIGLLENEALHALDHLDDESNSKRSSSEHSKHSRSSSSSSSSSNTSKKDKGEGEQLLTEM